MSRRTVLVAAAVLGVAGAAGVAVAATGADRTPAPAAEGPPATATVQRRTLARTVTVDGQLGYGEPVPLRSSATGTVTWLPKPGRVIARGRTVLRADNRPVVLFTGVLPIYRSLSPGREGPDVRQAERNLSALGYGGFTVDDEYTAATAEAVRRWQKKLGLPRTGTVDSSWVVVTNGSLRVAELKVRVGDPASGEVLTWTGAGPVVTVDAEADEAGWAEPGVRVSVALPDGTTVAGSVTHVGAKATAAEGEDPTVPVTVRLAGGTGALREAPVEVTYTGEQRKGVLSVPVSALLALAEGGYGLQVVEAGTTRYLPVKVGMFADGQVEVSGPGLAEGTVVGMPS